MPLLRAFFIVTKSYSTELKGNLVAPYFIFSSIFVICYSSSWVAPSSKRNTHTSGEEIHSPVDYLPDSHHSNMWLTMTAFELAGNTRLTWKQPVLNEPVTDVTNMVQSQPFAHKLLEFDFLSECLFFHSFTTITPEELSLHPHIWNTLNILYMIFFFF